MPRRIGTLRGRGRAHRVPRVRAEWLGADNGRRGAHARVLCPRERVEFVNVEVDRLGRCRPRKSRCLAGRAPVAAIFVLDRARVMAAGGRFAWTRKARDRRSRVFL